MLAAKVGSWQNLCGPHLTSGGVQRAGGWDTLTLGQQRFGTALWAVSEPLRVIWNAHAYVAQYPPSPAFGALHQECTDVKGVAGPIARSRSARATAAGAASHWFQKVRGEAPELAALVTGLDAAGKTTFMWKVRTDREQPYYHGTIGWNTDVMYIGTLKLISWDLDGQEKIRPLYRHYYPGVDAVIYMVDASDAERLADSGRELHALLNERELMAASNFPVLIFANKLDLRNAMSLEEVRDGLKLEAFEPGVAPPFVGSYDISLHGCSAAQGGGLVEGLTWLRERLPEFRTW